MAVKERKQITGTTAQINAYAGHEGQIVWDKEKKTFVGMSGISGTNYPLASKTYVANEVAKYLPLTGGNMTGEFTVNNFGSLVKQDIEGYEELVLQVYDKANQWTGGFLTLRGHSGSVEGERGSFILGARNKDGSTAGTFLGTPSGRLLWSGNDVLCVNGSGGGWLRYSVGLQICWGGIIIPQDRFNTVVNLPVPYVNNGYVISAMYTDVNNIPSVVVATGNKIPNAFAIAAASPAYNWNRYCEWITIGYWK